MEKEDKIMDNCCCYVCGDQGYKELLVDCIQCSQICIHKYCLGIVPGSLEDKQGIDWLCYYCSVSTSVLVEKEPPKPEPLCTVFPDGYVKMSEINEDEPLEIMRGVVLLASPSGETVMMYDDPSFGISSDVVKTKVARSKRRPRELEKLDLVGFRRSPRFKRRKLLHKSKGVVAY